MSRSSCPQKTISGDRSHSVPPSHSPRPSLIPLSISPSPTSSRVCRLTASNFMPLPSHPSPVPKFSTPLPHIHTLTSIATNSPKPSVQACRFSTAVIVRPSPRTLKPNLHTRVPNSQSRSRYHTLEESARAREGEPQCVHAQNFTFKFQPMIPGHICRRCVRLCARL
jgi:hypothetical protein